MFALGDALDDSLAIDPGGDPLLTQLHDLAVQIVAQRNYVNSLLAPVANADASIDFDQLTTETDYLGTLVAQFQAVAAQRTAQNPYALSAFDSAILAVGQWAQGVMAALPNTVAAIPVAFTNALANVANNAISKTTGALSSAAMGLIVPAGIVLGILYFAEQSRTYRRKVA